MAQRCSHGEQYCHQMLIPIPLTARQADNLETLRGSVTPLARTDDSHDSEQQSWTIDVRLLERMLLFETAGQRAHEADGSLSSSTLTPKVSHIHDKTQLSTGYDLIGSTGISGHKSVPKDRPMSAPELNSARSSRSNDADFDFFASIAPVVGNFAGAPDWSGLTGGDGVDRGGNMFFPANVCGRPMDGWLGMNLV